MEMIGRLVGTLFLAREYAHRAHLRVTGPGSYAKHVALGEFYNGIIENADSLTEAYQGRHDIIEIPYLDMISEEDPVKALEQCSTMSRRSATTQSTRRTPPCKTSLMSQWPLSCQPSISFES